MKTYETIIIGAGAAGIGTAIKLQEIGVDYCILEGHKVGSSFEKWNQQTHFISPSFPGNAFGNTDLNSIDYRSSPGFMFRKEHVNGVEYAQYLRTVVKQYDLNIEEGQKVIQIDKKDEYFHVQTESQEFVCKYLVSAIGEFQFPSDGNIKGSEHGIHSSKVTHYDSYSSGNDPVAIIGGYESSVDAAYGLYKKGIKSHIFCPEAMDDTSTSDPSVILSLYSLERLREIQEAGMVEFTYGHISEIKESGDQKILVGENSREYGFSDTPILATGFDTKFSFLGDMVSYRSDGNPDLSPVDELKKTENIFVVGPQVRQDELIFCFVYKFRLRFGVVALEIAKRLGKNIDYTKIQARWEREGFFLDDLGSCGDECVC